MPNAKNKAQLQSELFIENENFKFCYMPIVGRFTELNINMDKNLTLVAQHLEEPHLNFPFPIERESRQYGFNYDDSVQATVNTSNQSFALSLKHAPKDANHKFSFDLTASTWGLENFSLGYALCLKRISYLGAYYNS